MWPHDLDEVVSDPEVLMSDAGMVCTPENVKHVIELLEKAGYGKRTCLKVRLYF
ncbi:Hypothetical protein FKW44_014963 [Caligus rogercresseyi]|uniref:Uncharacterized protein n=1 Tax=Caligus rogercresseyi TaxID=217165 RepID=A0A7T8JZB1_CALRO|nr:Hypothetical protein FKW44_014963 [Caligus rogercresseyi]